MRGTDTRPIILSTLVGALAGAGIGFLIARRRARGGEPNVNAKTVTSVGVTALALVRQVIDLFS